MPWAILIDSPFWRSFLRLKPLHGLCRVREVEHIQDIPRQEGPPSQLHREQHRDAVTGPPTKPPEYASDCEQGPKIP